MTTAQTATQSAACRLRNSRAKHQQAMNSRRIHSPFFAEKLRIDDCSERFPRLIKSDGDKAGVYLRNIPANHPFRWDFKAFWNSSFTKLGSLA